jgi:raffinose/stachyose/melibiose transport system substrate-binding protein
MGANYDAILAGQLQAGRGPDLLFVRPYDARITQYLMALPHDDLPVQDTTYFDESKSDPWKGSDGRYYALPYVGVVQGIYYNKDFFTAHPEIPSPDTWQNWNDLLKYSQMIEDTTNKIPFANVLNTSNDSEMFQSILVNFVGGPEGRAKYSATSGSNQCFNSYEMVRAFNAIAQISPYTLNAKFTPEETAKLTDDAISKQYFIDQTAVMLFGGSWDLQYFTDNAKFEWSVFAPPPPIGAERYVIFQPDIGIGINSASPRKQEALTFLKWLMTDGVKETEKYLPGRYLLINSATGQTIPTTELVHAQDFAKLTTYPSDIRWMFSEVDGQYPRSSEVIKDALYRMVTPDSSGVYLSPNEAANLLQKGLGEWYPPAQTCK